MSTEPLRVGVVGLGFMGRTHLGAYAAARESGEPNVITAVCDRDPARRSGELGDHGNLATEGGLFDPNEVEGYEAPEQLFADPNVELVSICTHTPTHVPLAIAALEAGKHVLVEKPIALTSSAAQRLADAAVASDCICMPAMCMRFWPGWDTLLEALRDERNGELTSLVLRRLGVRPDWGAGFYNDDAAAGGAVFDLHVHDVDIVLAALGAPQRVHSAGTRDHIITRYDYGAGGPLVVAEGGWDHGAGFPFRMGYTAVFERATLDYDLQRDPPLQRVKGGVCVSRDLPPGDGYRGEVRAFLHAARTGDRSKLPTAADALAVTRLLESELAGL